MKLKSIYAPMKYRPVMALILMCIAFCNARGANPEAIKANATLLNKLDSLIANHKVIIENKENRISGLRKECSKSISPERRLEVLRAIYNEYKVYNPDSAMAYANAARRLVDEVYPNDPDQVAECLLDEAFIYSTQGFAQEAIENLERINPSQLSPDIKLHFFHTAQYIYSSRALFNNNGCDKSDPCLLKANAYRDSLIYLNPGHIPEVVWAPIAMQVEVKTKSDYKPDLKAVEQLEKAVESASEPSRENAINAYWLGRHYQMMGDDTKTVRYLTLAAIYDAEIENREIAAITELATLLFDNDDLDRAYTYLIYSSDQANAYNNRMRVLNVSNVLPTVRNAYHDAILERDHRLRIYLIVLIVLSLILLGSGALIYVENRRLRNTRQSLADANKCLEATVADRNTAIHALEDANNALSDTNKVLSEANKVKQELVALSFKLTSDYINALDDFRKKLLRKFKLKEYVELGVMLNDQELLREHYKEFYTAFDHTVLSIFPDFIEEYNSTAPDDAKADSEAIKKNHILNTRLRIHALRRLGVDKSADIARMLNVSIRTVYNNRN